jgi:hypothetical protein
MEGLHDRGAALVQAAFSIGKYVLAGLAHHEADNANLKALTAYVGQASIDARKTKAAQTKMLAAGCLPEGDSNVIQVLGW